MEPNKFEKHIKKQLQEREIRPSANAWEALSEKLDEVAPQPKKKSYLWYGIAASFIGLLILSTVYYNSRAPINGSEVQIVNTDEEVIETTTEETLIDAIRIEQDVAVENDKNEQIPTQKNETLFSSQTAELKNQVVSATEPNEVTKLSTQKVVDSDQFKVEMINNKILEIVAVVDSLEQNNNALTEAEVDDLLRNAQDEILRDKLFDQNGSVDAMALLIEVEDELDKSFRDQILESLKEGFLKVRTAVADRNK